MSKRMENHHRGRKRANGEVHLALNPPSGMNRVPGLSILAGAGPTPVLDRDRGASILVARDVDPVRILLRAAVGAAAAVVGAVVAAAAATRDPKYPIPNTNLFISLVPYM